MAAGIDVMVFIVGRSKGAILDHFDKAYEFGGRVGQSRQRKNFDHGPEHRAAECDVRYILTPSIFDKLENVPRGAGGEIQLTDAKAMLLADEVVLAYEFEGKRYDCGSKLGFLAATVEQSLKHTELKGPFKEFLRTIELG